MASRARARSTCAAGALSERLRRVSSWRSSAVSGRRGSCWWRDMGHLGARGSPHHDNRSHGKRPTSGRRAVPIRPFSTVSGPDCVETLGMTWLRYVRWGPFLTGTATLVPMHHIEGLDRDQAQLLPARVDDYVEADNPVRFMTPLSTGSTFRRRALPGCSR